MAEATTGRRPSLELTCNGHPARVLCSGWVRVNFSYFISEAVFEFILGPVEIVGSSGWWLVARYRFEPRERSVGPLGRGGRGADELRDIADTGGRMTYPSHRRTEPECAWPSVSARLDGSRPTRRHRRQSRSTGRRPFRDHARVPLQDEVAVRS
jgi:hypothetical protein